MLLIAEAAPAVRLRPRDASLVNTTHRTRRLARIHAHRRIDRVQSVYPRAFPRVRARRRASARANGDVCFDFDGVVCDSVGESSLSAWKHGEELWPDVFDADATRAEKERVLDGLRAVRPVVETGYENTTLARALLERLPGYSIEEILNDWDGLSGALMDKWSLDRATMVEAFGRIRDDWILNDFDGWLAPNALYPGVAEAVLAAQKRSDAAVKIVTTKQGRFALAILERMGKISIADDDMYSTTVSGIPKTDVLRTLGVDGNPRKIFVEDKLSTLEKVCKTDDLDEWELFLVDWGYNTESERARAAANDRITVIDISTFISLLREG